MVVVVVLVVGATAAGQSKGGRRRGASWWNKRDTGAVGVGVEVVVRVMSSLRGGAGPGEVGCRGQGGVRGALEVGVRHEVVRGRRVVHGVVAGREGDARLGVGRHAL